MAAIHSEKRDFQTQQSGRFLFIEKSNPQIQIPLAEVLDYGIVRNCTKFCEIVLVPILKTSFEKIQNICKDCKELDYRTRNPLQAFCKS